MIPNPNGRSQYKHYFISDLNPMRHIETDLNAIVLLIPAENDEQVDRDDLVTQFINFHGGTRFDYHFLEYTEGRLLLKLPHWIDVFELVKDQGFWLGETGYSIQFWHEIDNLTRFNYRYKVVISIAGFPINLWHPTYFRNVASLFGKLIGIDRFNLWGSDKTRLRLFILTTSNTVIPHNLVIAQQNEYTVCLITIETWEPTDDPPGNPPPPGNHGLQDFQQPPPENPYHQPHHNLQYQHGIPWMPFQQQNNPHNPNLHNLFFINFKSLRRDMRRKPIKLAITRKTLHLKLLIAMRHLSQHFSSSELPLCPQLISSTPIKLTCPHITNPTSNLTLHTKPPLPHPTLSSTQPSILGPPPYPHRLIHMDQNTEQQLLDNFAQLLKPTPNNEPIQIADEDADTTNWHSCILLKVLSERPWGRQSLMQALLNSWKDFPPILVKHFHNDTVIL